MTYEDALALALDAHRGQRDKVGEEMIRHSIRVAERVDSDDARVVALLHDVLEDTGVAASQLAAAGLPEPLLEAVQLLTRRGPAEEYETYIARVAQHPLARAVKLADVADNLERLPAWADVDPDGDEQRREKYERARARLLEG